MKKIVIIVLLVVCFPALAQSADGKSPAMAFLRISPGARPAALGESFVAVTDDANSTYWNPAGLALLEENQITFMHMFLWEDISYEYLAFARFIDDRSSWGANIIMLNSGAINKTFEDSLGFYDSSSSVGTYSYTSLAASFSYGSKLGTNFAYGLTVKVMSDSLDNANAQAAAVDIGMRYSPNRSVSLGFSAQNIGPGIKDESLPITVRFGAALLNPQFTIAIEGDYLSGTEMFKLGFGTEYRIKDVFIPRIGYNLQLASKDVLGGLTVGTGFTFGKTQIDYAFCPSITLGSTHRISITINLE